MQFPVLGRKVLGRALGLKSAQEAPSPRENVPAPWVAGQATADCDHGYHAEPE